MTRGEGELGGVVVVGVYEYVDALFARLFAPLVGYAVAAHDGVASWLYIFVRASAAWRAWSMSSFLMMPDAYTANQIVASSEFRRARITRSAASRQASS